MAVAIISKVISNYPAAVRPCDHHRALQIRRLDDGRELVGPSLVILVVLRIQWFVGTSVAPKVVGHNPERLREIAARLLDPREITLRKAMNEQDLGSAGVPPHLSPNCQTIRRLHRKRRELFPAAECGALNSRGRGQDESNRDGCPQKRPTSLLSHKNPPLGWRIGRMSTPSFNAGTPLHSEALVTHERSQRLSSTRAALILKSKLERQQRIVGRAAPSLSPFRASCQPHFAALARLAIATAFFSRLHDER